jgi:hypothetical protein
MNEEINNTGTLASRASKDEKRKNGCFKIKIKLEKYKTRKKILLLTKLIN